MKAFVAVLALAAAAVAEPQMFAYSNGFYPSVYGAGYAHAGLATYAHSPVVSTAGYYQPYMNAYATLAKPVKSIQASPGNVQTTIHKREAEADAFWPYAATTYAAHPYTYNAGVYNYAQAYAHPAAYASHAITPFGVKSYSNDAVKPFNYASKGSYVAQSAGAIHVAKREAESDSQFYASPLAYNAGYYPTTYATNYYSPSVYTTPYTYTNAYTNGYYHF